MEKGVPAKRGLRELCPRIIKDVQIVSLVLANGGDRVGISETPERLAQRGYLVDL